MTTQELIAALSDSADCSRSHLLGICNQAADELERLLKSNEELLAACLELESAADSFRADQGRAPDPRCGLVQPVTVAECEALNVACDKARIAIANAEKARTQ